MNPLSSLIRFSRRAACLIAGVGLSLSSFAAGAANYPSLLDDFSDSAHTHSGAQRLLVDDKAMGSQSHATQACANGVLSVQGELVPGRGLPAFISVPLLLSTDAQAQDLSAYEGVRIRVKILKGILSVQVASSEIQNFDFHTSGPVTAKRGEFQEVRVPFKTMKRAWSEQIPLNLKTITAVNLVSFGLAKDAFAYEVDEIGFY
jgi:hypothetical protein